MEFFDGDRGAEGPVRSLTERLTPRTLGLISADLILTQNHGPLPGRLTLFAEDAQEPCSWHGLAEGAYTKE